MAPLVGTRVTRPTVSASPVGESFPFRMTQVIGANEFVLAPSCTVFRVKAYFRSSATEIQIESTRNHGAL